MKKVEPADVETRDMEFLHKEGGELVFLDTSNKKQVTISAELTGDAHDLLTSNLSCKMVFFNGRPVDVTLPTFVFLEVTTSESDALGESSADVQKSVTVETGAQVSVPVFIRVGDLIKVDTRTHEYFERVKKT